MCSSALLVLHGEGVIFYSSSSPLVVETTCPSGYSQYEGSCYKFHLSESVFDEAEKSCLKEGANLVKIETAAEQAFINSE